MDIKISDLKKLIVDINEYIEKSYSRILRQKENKETVLNWIVNLNKISDETKVNINDCNNGNCNIDDLMYKRRQKMSIGKILIKMTYT
jgi:hypothetical protein